MKTLRKTTAAAAALALVITVMATTSAATAQDGGDICSDLDHQQRNYFQSIGVCQTNTGNTGGVVAQQNTGGGVGAQQTNTVGGGVVAQRTNTGSGAVSCPSGLTELTPELLDQLYPAQHVDVNGDGMIDKNDDIDGDGDLDDDDKVTTAERFYLYHVEGLCQHQNLSEVLTPEEARELLAQFRLSEFSRNPLSDLSHIFCGPGERPTPQSDSVDGISYSIGCVTTNEGRRLDYLNYLWSSYSHPHNCPSGEKLGYTNGGDGSIVCGALDQFVNCTSGNSAGVTGRRCIRTFHDWTPAEVQRWESTQTYPTNYGTGDNQYSGCWGVHDSDGDGIWECTYGGSEYE